MDLEEFIDAAVDYLETAGITYSPNIDEWLEEARCEAAPGGGRVSQEAQQQGIKDSPLRPDNLPGLPHLAIRDVTNLKRGKKYERTN
jgi:hypothetical protein